MHIPGAAAGAGVEFASSASTPGGSGALAADADEAPLQKSTCVITLIITRALDLNEEHKMAYHDGSVGGGAVP